MPHNPSPFYQCPHCHHVLLKDSTMMKLAGVGGGFGIVGGGCPDCRQPLDAEKVYIACEYDLSIADIAGGNYPRSVIDNVLAAHRSGKVSLTTQELSLLAPTSPAHKKPIRKYLWLLLLIFPVLAGVGIWVSVIRQTPDKFGMPPSIKASVLNGAASGSSIVSAQNVQKEGLDFWCVVTSSCGELTRWVASETGNASADAGNSSVILIQDAGWENFSKLGCTNWAAEDLTRVVSATELPPTGELPAGQPAAGTADFNIPVFGVILTYPTDQWQISKNGKVLEWIDQPGCRVYAPDSLYSSAEIPPDKTPDRSVVLAGVEFAVYKYTNNNISGEWYRGAEAINPAVSGQMPMVFFVEWPQLYEALDPSTTYCLSVVEEVLNTVRSEP